MSKFQLTLPLSRQAWTSTMSALPVYQVEFIPLERRLGDRRIAPFNAELPSSLVADRRMAPAMGRRIDDRKPTPLKLV
jgi:hypothetical protein